MQKGSSELSGGSREREAGEGDFSLDEVMGDGAESGS